MGARKYIGRLQELPTPFYFYDMDLLRGTLATAVSEASRYGYRIHYALKANFDPRIVETIRQAGLGADCVSGNEVRAAIEAGFPAEGIGFRRRRENRPRNRIRARTGYLLVQLRIGRRNGSDQRHRGANGTQSSRRAAHQSRRRPDDAPVHIDRQSR